MGIKLMNIDCLEGMKLMEENSIDAIVTDPPYGLSFMGKHWDYEIPSVEIWKECLRVLKPGGYLLSFAGTRTQHRMACNIEDAGFEIRDMIAWVYGSGFPKSLNISKQIDKMGKTYEFFDEVRIFLKEALNKSGLSFKEINEAFNFATNGSGMAGHWFANITQQTLPTKAQWFKLKEILNFRSDFDETFNSCVNPNERPIIGIHSQPASEIYRSGKLSKEVYLTESVSDEAKEFEGWGTALKPALEPITVARKPLSEKTVAENCLKWGTGGINIDGCRILAEEKWIREKGINAGLGGEFLKGKGEISRKGNDFGRFPANLIHDGSEEVLELFPNTQKSKGNYVRKNGEKQFFGQMGSDEVDLPNGINDSGSAARFFYCAKASKSERNMGCEELEEKQTVGGGGGIGNYLDDVNSTSGKYGSEKAPAKNNHPTVKPIALMEYLVKLVTPKGGTVFDPFAGTATTLIACDKLGFNAIGFEREKEYHTIGLARMKNKKPERVEHNLFSCHQ